MLHAQPSTVTVEEAIDRAYERSPERLRLEGELQRARRIADAGSAFFPSRPEIEVDYETESPFGSRDYQLKVELSQEFEIGGQRGLRQALANQAAEQVRLGEQALRQRVGVTTRLLYNRAWILAQQVELGNQLLVVANRLVDVADKRLQAGDISELERNSIVLEANRQRIAHEKVHSEHEQAMGELAALIGSDTLLFELEQDRLFPINSAYDSLSTFAQFSPVWLRLQRDIAQAEAALALARASTIPNPTLGVSLISGLGTIDEEEIHYIPGQQATIREIVTPERALGVRFAMQLPIAVSGLWSATSLEVAEREAELGNLRAELEELRITMTARTVNLIPKLRRIRRALAIYDESVSLIAENTELLERGYTGGQLSVTELLIGRQQLMELQNEQLELLRELRETEIELTLFATE